MILSHKYKFIFIKTRKTAGTSIECALADICGDDDIITPISAEDEQFRKRGPQNYKRNGAKVFYNHMTAAEVLAQVGPEVFYNYFKFTVERNPFEKVISLYWYLINAGFMGKIPLQDFVRGPRLAMVKDWDHYTIDDALAVDMAGRYEALDSCLWFVADRLGLDPLWLPRAKANFRHDRRPAAEVFSENEKNIIARYFANEIKFFGYGQGDDK